tara:strand:+ start:45 stop:386 length:342 start_codon:yes stop_codon:yes gene_type:complete
MATYENATHEQTPIPIMPCGIITEAINPHYAFTDYHISTTDICAPPQSSPMFFFCHIISSFSFYLTLFFCVASVFFYAHFPHITLGYALEISDLCTFTALIAGIEVLHPEQTP